MNWVVVINWTSLHSVGLMDSKVDEAPVIGLSSPRVSLKSRMWSKISNLRWRRRG